MTAASYGGRCAVHYGIKVQWGLVSGRSQCTPKEQEFPPIYIQNQKESINNHLGSCARKVEGF